MVTFEAFKNGNLKCLIATNVAARGLDIPNVDLIIQLDPPKDPDVYVHRAGRTGRMGKTGTCITFFSNKNLDLLEKIEREANVKIQRVGLPQAEDLILSLAEDVLN